MPTDTKKPTKDEQFIKMHHALGLIAFERKGPDGGYVSRRDQVAMARRVLVECGLEWSVNGAL